LLRCLFGCESKPNLLIAAYKSIDVSPYL